MATTPAPNEFRNPIAVAKAVLSAATSVTATVMVVRSVVRPFIPREFQDFLFDFLFSRIRGFSSRFCNEMTMVIERHDGYAQNELFGGGPGFPGRQAIRFRTAHASDQNQMLVDTFHGVKLKWVLVSRQVGSVGNRVHQGPNSTVQHGDQYFELTFDKKHKEIVDKSYLPFVMNQAKSIKQEKKTLKLYTTLAMDLELKKKILDDLDRFVRRKEYYRRVGKVWKRGYLLYGPPGTGKSSLVAAMANYLNFDVYDLELSGLRSNANLRRLLVATTNQSILVVEDIDCTIQLQDRNPGTRAAGMNPMLMCYQQQDQVTLSGFLNFTDGLWLSCGNEQIIVFMTNHVEKLDPAILRPGRMDLHIPMSYCTPCGFRLLAYNYLGIDHHELSNQIESAITMARVTPAEVAEELMKCDESEIILRDMVSFLTNHKRKENEEVIKEN
ncbi:hypothetical protein EUGRSUZ_J02371, partial [Eucalyptus grandis]